MTFIQQPAVACAVAAGAAAAPPTPEASIDAAAVSVTRASRAVCLVAVFLIQ
jgi:hypothetical protein